MDEVNGLRYALAETRRPSEQIERLAEAVESVGNLNMHLDRRSTLFVHVPMDAIVYRTDPDKIINMQIRDVSVRVYGASLAVGLHAEESALPANAMRELLRGIVVSAAMKAADETPIPDMKDVA